jgi:hypothetical protein
MVYEEIAFPPVAGVVHVILFVFADNALADGDPGALGTVVTVIEEVVSDAFALAVPAALVPLTVTVYVPAGSPVSV